MKNEWTDLDTGWMGCKILVCSLGFFYGESCIPAEVLPGLKPTPSLLTVACVLVAHEFPWLLPTLKSTWAAAVVLMKNSLGFGLGKCARAAYPNSNCSPSVLLNSQQAGTHGLLLPAAGVELLHHWSSMKESHPFLSLIYPTPQCSKNAVEKHQKKHFCLFIPTL